MMAPEIGDAVFPEIPRYHWNVGEVPEATTARFAVPPLATATEDGEVVIAGGILTVIVAVVEFALPAELVALAQ